MVSLVGIRVPDLELPASNGTFVKLATQQGTSVVFCYPYTGRPGYADPPGWDSIPGAHGSTPQALAFSTLYQEFATLKVKIFGLSFNAKEWQQDFADRNHLPYLLLSDEARKFSEHLKLETFEAGQKQYLKRRSFVIENGIIIKDIFPVLNPAANAEEILSLHQK